MENIELRYTLEVKSDNGWIKLNNAFPIPAENPYEFDYDKKHVKINLITKEVK